MGLQNLHFNKALGESHAQKTPGISKTSDKVARDSI